jgi:hypothetical protein
MRRSYTSSPPQAPLWRVVGYLFFYPPFGLFFTVLAVYCEVLGSNLELEIEYPEGDSCRFRKGLKEFEVITTPPLFFNGQTNSSIMNLSSFPIF